MITKTSIIIKKVAYVLMLITAGFILLRATKTSEPLQAPALEHKATTSVGSKRGSGVARIEELGAKVGSKMGEGPILREVTAYTARVEETDGEPCIAADGSDICLRRKNGEDLCVANFVPFGTTLALSPTDYGGTERVFTCVVTDRMASYNGDRVDLFMGNDLQGAMKWGVRKMMVTVLP